MTSLRLPWSALPSVRTKRNNSRCPLVGPKLQRGSDQTTIFPLTPGLLGSEPIFVVAGWLLCRVTSPSLKACSRRSSRSQAATPIILRKSAPRLPQASQINRGSISDSFTSSAKASDGVLLARWQGAFWPLLLSLLFPLRLWGWHHDMAVAQNSPKGPDNRSQPVFSISPDGAGDNGLQSNGRSKGTCERQPVKRNSALPWRAPIHKRAWSTLKTLLKLKRRMGMG